MVGERTDLAHCLFEGVLDLEAQSVQTNDVEGVEGSVGAFAFILPRRWRRARMSHSSSSRI
jgi:hypothetical protein